MNLRVRCDRHRRRPCRRRSGVGGGAQWDADVAICTLADGTVAHMPCNPAIGGTAKGHLVREIDALGGLMGVAIDATGDPVQAAEPEPRTGGLVAARAGRQAALQRVGARPRSRRSRTSRGSIGKAGGSSTTSGRVQRSRARRRRRRIGCGALVVTTGTFLNGLVHVGPEQRPAGRAGEPPSRELAESIKSFGFTWGRLKTGTPPRLHRRSIDFSRFRRERGDDAIRYRSRS